MKRRALRYAARSHDALAANERHAFAARHALCLYRQNAVYSFIPKNACSTLRLTLANENGCIDGTAHHDWIHANNDTFRASLRELATADYAFVILRCPYARLASLYLDKMVRREPPYWSVIRHETFKPSWTPLSFRHFLSFVEKNPKLDLHWRPQVDFLVYRDYDDWFAFEDFATAAARLEERLAIEIVDARPLTRHGQDRFRAVQADGGFADTPVAEIEAMNRAGESPDKRALYDDALVKKVARLYRNDLALYADLFGRAGLLFPEAG